MYVDCKLCYLVNYKELKHIRVFVQKLERKRSKYATHPNHYNAFSEVSSKPHFMF